jgi:hypothetical protein
MNKSVAMAAFVLATGITAQMFGCSEEVHTAVATTEATPLPVAQAAAPSEVTHPLKPEMIIVFTKGTLACLTKDDLLEMMEHGAKSEATKMQAMMVENGGSCLMIPSEKRVKIISVEYNDPVNMPDLGVIEFVGEGTTSLNGAWALSIGAEPAPPVKPKAKAKSH